MTPAAPRRLSIRLLVLVATLAGPSCLSACTSAGDQLNDFGSSISGGFGRNTDTLGTGRRVDVYGGSTAPSLPTSSSGGFR